jgi:hypothetical protein
MFVRGDDGGLDPDGSGDRRREGAGFQREDGQRLALQLSEERGVFDERRLDHLRQPARSSRGGRVARDGRVRQHQARLVKGAQQVLAAGRVDRGLTAHGAVHLGQQSGRHLDEGRAALVDRGRETREVADYAAAERRDRFAAIQPQRHQGVQHALELGEALAASPGGR